MPQDCFCCLLVRNESSSALQSFRSIHIHLHRLRLESDSFLTFSADPASIDQSIMQHDGEHITVAGTITGTIFSVAATIDHQDYYKTVILAAVGAAASFLVTVVLRWLWNRFMGPK